jgi:DNA-binding GntR family transcriptional regulator
VAVTELGDDEIAEVYRAKRALEVAGIAASADAPKEWLDQLRAVSAEIGRARSADQLAEADLAFHTHVVRAIQSRQLDEQYRNIQAQLRLTRAWTVRQRGGARQMYELHQEVVDALAAGDRDRASALLGAINDEGERRLREAIRDRARDDGMPKLWPATDAQSWRTVAATAVAGTGD